MKHGYLIVMLLTVLCFVSCDKGETIDCDKTTLIDNDGYLNGPNSHVTIIDARINQNCLNITFGASGCDGRSWEIELYDSENIAESFPEQRYIRLSLKNDELCDAYFQRELSFDVSELKVSGEEVILNLTNWDEPIHYIY